MKRKKTFFTWLIGAICFSSAMAQSLTIEECQEMARSHYPAIAQYDIIAQSAKYNLKNANTAYFPQLSLTAQATYQTEVPEVPISLPNVEIPVPDKDQYRVVAELNQVIWDGGQTAARKAQIIANAEVEKHKIETESYALRERVNGVFFGILLLKEQLQQQSVLEKELQRNYDKVENYINNGVANEADLGAVKVQQLKTRQQRAQMESALKAYLKTLSALTGTEIDENTTFVKPTLETLLPSPAIHRPELQLFNAQHSFIDSQTKVLRAKNLPTIGAFAQGGYGKPGLNLFSNDFSPYFIGGVRLSWNISNLYRYKNEKRNIDLQKQLVDSKRETFLYNINAQIPKQQLEIEKYRAIMQDDSEIIRNQQLIKTAAEAKVENGTMTVADLLGEINALELAKQAKSLHEIQYLMSIYNLKHTTN